MKVQVLFVSHRIEFLKEFEKEALNYDVVVLEEPPNTKLFDYLNGRISKNDYLESLETSFPKYTSYYLEVLRRLYVEGKKILQIEPYLEKLGEIYELIEKGDVGGDEVVRLMERRVTKAWIEYQEAFLKRNFDGLVEKTIEFTKVDAERFKVRDKMRAEKIAESIPNADVLIEAGQIHVLLPILLKDKGLNVTEKSIPAEVAKRFGYKWMLNPGSELTVKYILGEKVDKSYERIAAARALVYISMVSKEEIVPTADQSYPHLMDELNVVKFVNALDYDGCRKIFEKIWTNQ